MVNPRAVLEVQAIPAGGSVIFAANRLTLTIGRADDNDVVIADNRVSRHHLRVELDSEGVVATDLGSVNGVWVGEALLAPRMPTRLPAGTPLDLTGYRLVMRTPLPGDPSPSTGRVKVATLSQPFLEVTCAAEITRYPLEKEITTLGRADDNDIVITHAHISRHQAQISRTGEQFTLTDLGSINPLMLNGQVALNTPLKNGDLVALTGEQVKLKFAQGLELILLEPLGAENRTLLYKPDSQSTAFLNLKGREIISIGRAADNNIILSYALVSQHHALIERMGSRYRIKDTKSESGVFVNQVRIDREAWLKEGDEIQIGGIKLILSANGIQQVAEQGWEIDALHLNKWVSKNKNLLQDISLCIYPQEFVALVGMSGSGKSTLMDALNGFRPATQGQVLVNQVDIYRHFDLFRNDIGYVPQKDIVHQELTVYKALEYAAQLRMPADTLAAERGERILKVLDSLDLVERRDLPIYKLSGGQLKRVSIGVELLTEPHLFFLDEPTSGLDPGTELEMMRLLRRLADQGRTVMLITHATKNVMMCDRVIFLARGGYLAYFGPPEEALVYFDQYRTPQERQREDIEFDDIYLILGDAGRGSGADWDARYRRSSQFRENVLQRLQPERSLIAPEPIQAVPGQMLKKETKRPATSTLRQFGILSARNLQIMFQDKFGLALMLALAPIIGLMDFIWGNNLFSSTHGDATRIITMLFMAALITILVGAMASVREIVKEGDIYKRERAINLKLTAYILSKIWVGFILSIYQAVVLLLFLYLFTLHSSPLAFGDYGLILVTMFLGTLSGYMMGLCISAAAPNQNVALLLVIVVLVPQFLFSGALLPLDIIPGGKIISAAASTRWAFEAMVNISGMGRDVINDPCWQTVRSQHILPSDLAEDQKESLGCHCMGVKLFTSCQFPGIQNPEFYSEAAQQALASARPVEPLKPTALPSPSPLPSLTPYFTLTPEATLTPYPTLTPPPTPQDLRLLNDYQATREAQGKEYEDLRLVQGKEYEQMRVDQGKEYEQLRIDQGNQYRDTAVAQGSEYEKTRVAQGDEYTSEMKTYGDLRETWQRDREKAISAAEGTIKVILDNYAMAFEGSVASRWTAMLAIIMVVFILLIVFQKRKDSL